MATYPHEPTQLSENEKKAYRYLLYMAMLHIRNLLCESPNRFSLNPLWWQKKYMIGRTVGGLADWLHNLAEHAEMDFIHFNTERFWKEYETFCMYYADSKHQRDYRKLYEDELIRLNKSNLPIPFYDYAMEEPSGEIVEIGRVYCLTVNDFTPADWDRLRNTYQSLPHFVENASLPSWFGADETKDFHLIASVEPTGIEVTGFLRLIDWLDWDVQFRARIAGMPSYEGA
jgi:hypothetical protein